MDMIPSFAVDSKHEIAKGLQAYFDKYARHGITGNVEIRLIGTIQGKPEISGMFFKLDDPDHLIKMVDHCYKYSQVKNIKGVYITPNPSDKKRYHFTTQKGNLTKDEDVAQCYHLLVDIDPIRRDSAGLEIKGDKPNCTNNEKQNAVLKADAIKNWINSACGTTLEPTEIDSGNGFYLHYDFMPPPHHSKQIVQGVIKQMLKILAKRFNDDSVDIDVKVFNASRIQRVPGTWNRKGDGGYQDRPKETLSQLIKKQTTDETVVWNSLLKIVENNHENELATSYLVKDVTYGEKDLVKDAGEGYQTTPPAPASKNTTDLSRPKDAAKKLEISISGQNGHNKAFHACCFIIQKFPHLSDDEVMETLHEWNNRCLPPWSEQELRHKVKDARKTSKDDPVYFPDTETTAHQTSERKNDNRREIELKTGRLDEVRKRTIKLLNAMMEYHDDIVLLDHKGCCADVFIFKERIVKGAFSQPAGMATIRKTSESLIRLTLSKHLNFYTLVSSKGGELIQRYTDAPLALVKAIADEPSGLTQLHFLAHGPFISFQNFKLVNKPGIDIETNRYLVNQVDGLEPLIPAEPTHADAKNAMHTIWNAVREFPWMYNHAELCKIEDNMLNHDGNRQDQIINQSFVKWLTLLIAQAVRLELDVVPLGLITANTPGLGKTYLAHAISLILFGRTASVTVLPEGTNMQNRGDELRKRLISQIESGETFTLIDNVSRTSGADFSSPELEAFITSSDFSDRQLGTNTKRAGGRHRMQIIVTGNGTSPGPDLADRTLFVKLQSDQPNRRHHFKPKDGDFLEYCRKNRKTLLAAVLTIVKSWLIAGSPKPHTSNGFGSFPDFNAIPIAIAHWVSDIDPLEGRLSDIVESDVKGQARAALISNWTGLLGREPLTCGQILERIKSPSLSTVSSEQLASFKEAMLELVPGTFRVDDLPAAKQLGRALKQMANTPTYLPANETTPAATGRIIQRQNSLNSSVYSVYIQGGATDDL